MGEEIKEGGEKWLQRVRIMEIHAIPEGTLRNREAEEVLEDQERLWKFAGKFTERSRKSRGVYWKIKEDQGSLLEDQGRPGKFTGRSRRGGKFNGRSRKSREVYWTIKKTREVYWTIKKRREV
jgi:hypothetical protein